MTEHRTSRSLLALVAIAVLPALLVFVVLLASGGRVGKAQSQAAVEPGKPGLRVYSIVLDGLMPHEIDPVLTPNLWALRQQGTWYEQARAVFPAETVPNHVAMMTGVLPSRSGIVGNDFWQPNDSTSKQKAAHPMQLGVDTLVTRLESRCKISTATVMSKGYLWGIFRSEPPADPFKPAGYSASIENPNPDHPGNQLQADHHWKPMGQPGYIPDPDDHAIDQATMEDEPGGQNDVGGFMSWLRSNPETPQFAFLNLGDIDRSGHVDMSGNAGGISAFRQSALADTDNHIGNLVKYLKDAGVWDETVLIFTSDHGMDWSVPDNGANLARDTASIDVAHELQNKATAADGGPWTIDAGGKPGKEVSANPATQGDVNVVPGGGTAAVYIEEQDDIEPIAKFLGKHPAVEVVATPDRVPGLENNPTLGEMGMRHRHNGDVVVLVRPSWAVRDFSSGNPIPGNHGHPVTDHSVLMVAGGHAMLDDAQENVEGEPVYAPGKQLFAPPEGGPGNLSVAPTVAAIFGIGEPPGGYDGKPLTQAFEPWALGPHEPCSAPTPTPPQQAQDEEPAEQEEPPAGEQQDPAPADPGPPAPPSGREADEPGPTLPPILSPLRIRPKSFIAGKGATVRYSNSQASRTTFIVQRARRGYRRGRYCVPRKPRTTRRVRRCRYYELVSGSFARQDSPGRVRFRFSGRLNGRKLRPGRYRLRAVARNAIGRSQPVRASFRIRRP